MLLCDNNIKAELSYAYLHAVASRSGFACEWGNRHEDGIGVDAKLRVRERFADDSRLTNFTVDVQLKSTSSEPKKYSGRYSFPLPIKNYDELRSTNCAAQQLLVVLYLPDDAAKWLTHTAERLELQTCAFWVSLRNAPESDNRTVQTVYLPTENRLCVEKLRPLMARLSRMEVIDYDPSSE